MNKEVPTFLKELLIKDYGEETTDKIIKGYAEKRKVTLRVNTIKTNADTIKETLKEAEIEYQDVQWSNNALILENASEDKIRNLDIYKNRRNIFAKPIINATTNNTRTES